MIQALIFWIDDEEFSVCSFKRNSALPVKEWAYEYMRDWYGDMAIFVEWV